jgi:hypothetical protein
MMSKAFLAVTLISRGLTLGVVVGVGTGVGVGVGVGSTGLNTGLGDGFGAALTAMPLFQTSFVPDLTHVNFLPDEIDIVPALLHFAPALTTALAATCVVAKIMRQTIATNHRLLARKVKKFTN